MYRLTHVTTVSTDDGAVFIDSCNHARTLSQNNMIADGWECTCTYAWEDTWLGQAPSIAFAQIQAKSQPLATETVGTKASRQLCAYFINHQQDGYCWGTFAWDVLIYNVKRWNDRNLIWQISKYTYTQSCSYLCLSQNSAKRFEKKYHWSNMGARRNFSREGTTPKKSTHFFGAEDKNRPVFRLNFRVAIAREF